MYEEVKADFTTHVNGMSPSLIYWVPPGGTGIQIPRHSQGTLALCDDSKNCIIPTCHATTHLISESYLGMRK